MKVVYIANSCEHVVRPLCDGLHKHYGNDFTFIETQVLNDSRAEIGSRQDRPYIWRANGNDDEARRICCEADVVIFGGVSTYYIQDRIKENKPTIYYSERLFKRGYWRYFNPITMKHVRERFVLPSRNSNFHLICASSYASLDFARVGAFKNKMYKWGYQIEVKEKNIDTLMASKPEDGLSIIWVGRLVKLKHCDHAIRVIKMLKDAGYMPRLKIIGSGVEQDKLQTLVKKLDLTDLVAFAGACDIETTRAEMDKANIFLFTSDFGEGWGATLNECMNSGCACVASHGAGSTYFLTEDEKDALVYKSGDIKKLYEKTKRLIDDRNLRERIGRCAYAKMFEVWNPLISYNRMVTLIENICNNSSTTLYDSGPCSPAEVITSKWHK